MKLDDILKYIEQRPFCLPGVLEKIAEEPKILDKVLSNMDQDLVYLYSAFNPLTNLPNRAFFYRTLERQLILACEYGTPFGVGVLDLDGFKFINDTFGHVEGDRLLFNFGDYLRTQTNTSQDHDRRKTTFESTPLDFVAHYGGDEFSFTASCKDPETLTNISERLCREVGSVPVLTEYNIQMSIGAVWFNPNKNEKPSPINLVEQADSFLYVAKECGKNKACVGIYVDPNK